ncbi:response regulator transcription factor [Pseudalkalibacillus caeni]|uniref:Response regulator n=1 Tax=Exobacillus caeni TaxID=2574798 RepID=A0A5R9FAG2_9BACL|nr:response regulator [Pseudalkalibacillus caeni]TLS38648.1 response regulator [Pseudalkalibacillus caeni]
MNVLLVDDEPFVSEQLEMMIKPICPFWNLYKAYDSSQALKLSQDIQFQLAFLDIEMPGKSGLELAKELKEQFQGLNIVILTAYQDFDYAQQSIKIGVSDYLTKPIIESELKEVIKRYANEVDYTSYSKLIKDTLQIVHERYGEKLNLSIIAGDVHANSSYLSRKFSDEVDMPFSDYLTNYRIEMAKSLLENSSLSVSEIAVRTGFSSLHYFSTMFKKKVGITPKKYREEGT